jgi:hypothetical protein
MAAEGPSSENQKEQELIRSLEDAHRDIALANQYRLEFIKHTMSLATAVLVFTVSFVKDALPSGAAPQSAAYIGYGWFAMAISLIGGLAHMVGWDRFYISYRDYDYRGDGVRGKEVRKKITFFRRIAMFLQIAGFGFGLLLITYFYFTVVTSTR